MTDDPKRLLEGGGGATGAERDLLRSAGDVEPGPGAHDAMWAALATRLPPGGGGSAPPPAAGPGGAGAGGSAIGAKTVAVGLIGAVIVIGAVVFMQSRGAGHEPPVAIASAPPAVAIEPPPAVAGSTSAASEPAGVPSEPTPVATGSVTRPAPSAPRLAPGSAGGSSTASAGTSSATDALRDEIALVAAARAALRSGDGSAALASLETARTRHPRGALLQEREVLTIEAMAQSGDTQGASRRANAFLRAFPTSPHAAHVRTFAR